MEALFEKIDNDYLMHNFSVGALPSCFLISQRAAFPMFTFVHINEYRKNGFDFVAENLKVKLGIL